MKGAGAGTRSKTPTSTVDHSTWLHKACVPSSRGGRGGRGPWRWPFKGYTHLLPERSLNHARPAPEPPHHAHHGALVDESAHCALERSGRLAVWRPWAKALVRQPGPQEGGPADVDCRPHRRCPQARGGVDAAPTARGPQRDGEAVQGH